MIQTTLIPPWVSLQEIKSHKARILHALSMLFPNFTGSLPIFLWQIYLSKLMSMPLKPKCQWIPRGRKMIPSLEWHRLPVGVGVSHEAIVAIVRIPPVKVTQIADEARSWQWRSRSRSRGSGRFDSWTSALWQGFLEFLAWVELDHVTKSHISAKPKM